MRPHSFVSDWLRFVIRPGALHRRAASQTAATEAAGTYHGVEATTLVAGGSARRTAGGVVPVTSASGEFATTAGWDDIHLYGAKSAVAFGVGRIVRERILIADVVGHVFANVLHVGYVFREKSQAAGGFGDFFQCPFGAFGVFLALFA